MNSAPTDPDTPPTVSAIPAGIDGSERLARLLETSIDVQRRHQFFNWASNHLYVLAPHRVLVCGHYDRQQRAIRFDCFYSVPLSAATVALLNDAGGDLLRAVSTAWAEGVGNPLAFELFRLSGAAGREAERLGRETDCSLLLVHGLSRPQRPEEIEGLYLMLCHDQARVTQQLQLLEMIVPTMHAVWRRVQSAQALVPGRSRAAGAAVRNEASPSRVITDREAEILGWVRQGLSNQQIAERLGISPLTVKNHMQKLLRKLGAGNRAQAVALAMSQDLLPQRTEDPAHR